MDGMMIGRRMLIGGIGAVALAGRAGARVAPTLRGAMALREAITVAERDSGGRLGVAVRDLATGRTFAMRGDERFPMCSTFKFLLVGAVLRRVDTGTERLDRRLPVRAGDVVDYAPFAGPLVGGDATVRDLCDAALTLSDNMAANLLLGTIGGPAGLTRFIRATGDRVTRADRTEPTLNTAIPGDPRDTTSPVAMLGCVERIATGDVLTPASRALLTGWLVANTTGGDKLRAGLPAGWRVGDKTGSGANGTSNDIAIVWRPDAAPLLIASYLTRGPEAVAERSAVHARVARAIVAAL